MTLSQSTRNGLTIAGLLILRLGVAVPMLSLHGWSKYQQRAEMAPQFGQVISFLSPEINFWLAVFAELVCASLVAVGLLTRLAAIPLIITMGVAFFMVHQMQLTGPQSGEMALIYGIPFVVLLFTGPGAFSLDQMIFGGKKSKSD